MKAPVRIHSVDSDEQARDRHKRIEARLEELGIEQVRGMMSYGGLPTNWDPIIARWLKGDRLEDEKKDEKTETAPSAPRPGED